MAIWTMPKEETATEWTLKAGLRVGQGHRIIPISSQRLPERLKRYSSGYLMGSGRSTKDLVLAIARQERQAIQHLHFCIIYGLSCCAFWKTCCYKKSVANVELQKGIAK